MKTTRRLTALMLSILMLLSVLTQGVFAAGGTGEASLLSESNQIIINMHDYYGDGWNGAAIQIYGDGTLIETATFSTDYEAVWSAAYNSLCTYTFKWFGGYYPEECSFEIVVDGETVYSAETGSCVNYTEGQIVYTLETRCEHSLGEDGLTCTICGKVCGVDFAHKFDDNHTCTVCSYACGTENNPHDWSDGVCAVCGTACPGHNYENDVCTICGISKKISINMFISSEHSWNGSEILIYKDGVQVDSASSGFYSMDYDSYSTYEFKWKKGYYAYECSFDIQLDGAVVFSAATTDCASFSDGQTVYTIESKCAHSFTGDSLTCTACGKTCGAEFIHKFDDNNICTVCGYACGTESNPHDWSDGVCAACGTACPGHNYEDSVCTRCGLICGTDVLHSFDDNNTCTVCGYACGTENNPHDWSDGVCAVCGTACPGHNYENDVCTICGINKKITINMYSADDYSWGGAEILIYKDGEHIDSASGANTDSYSIDYDSHATYEFRWSPGSFDTECSFEILLDGETVFAADRSDCANYYIMGGYIFTLASACEHSAGENGLCGICGRTCGNEFAHIFDDNHTCTVCGFECGTADNGHSWSNGACSICGYSCEHSFDNGACTSCGVENKIAVKMFCNDIPWNSIGIEVYKDGVLEGTAALDGSSSDDIWSIDYDSLATYTFIYKDTTYEEQYFFEISAVGKTLLTVKIPECENLTDGQIVYTLASTCEHSPDENGLCENCGRTCGNEFAHEFSGDSCSICGLKTEIIGYDIVSKKATINVAETGEYTIIFADYSDGSLNDADIKTTILEQGTNEIETTLALDINDKIMLWENITTLKPLCEALEITG